MGFPRAYAFAAALTLAGCGSSGAPAPSAVPSPPVSSANVAGQSRQTSPLMTARTCEYHDHTVHDDHHGFGGRIVIH